MSTTVQELATDQGIVRVPTGTWKVDPTHSAVEFKIRHMMVSTVRGRFGEFEGTLEAAPDYHDSRAYGFCQVASIDTGNAQRDEHLRSPDFFDAEHYPTISFESTAVEHLDAGRYRVKANLTMKGVTREIEALAEIQGAETDPWGNQRVGIEIRSQINRNDFDLRWQQALETGGMLLGEKVEIEIDVSLVASEDGQPTGS